MSRVVASCGFIRREHLPHVVAISSSLPKPSSLSEDQITSILALRDTYGLVAIEPMTDAVLGYLLYQRQPARHQIVMLAVREDRRRRGVASQLLSKMKDKITKSRPDLHAIVRESNLEMLMTLRANKFLAQQVLRSHFSNPEDDGIDMVFSLA